MQSVIGKLDDKEKQLFSSSELYLIGEGNELLLYDKLGAQFREINGMQGVVFSVWAPNAQKVSVTGDFNEWNPESHPMCRQGDAGVWAVFVPHVGQGAHYKFHLVNALGKVVEKTDPMGTLLRAGTKERSDCLGYRSIQVDGRSMVDCTSGTKSLRIAHEYLRGAPWLMAKTQRR